MRPADEVAWKAVHASLGGRVYAAITEERRRQDTKWHRSPGEWPDGPGVRYCVLAEEVGEVAKALLEDKPHELKTELVQVAAVCVAWLEAIEATELAGEPPEDRLFASQELWRDPRPGSDGVA